MFAVKLDKGCDFLGREALVSAARKPPERVCVSIVAKDADAPMAWGGELILAGGRPVGEVISAGFGAALGRLVMLGYVATRGEPIDAAWLAAHPFEVDIAGARVPVVASLKAPYDPSHGRTRS